MSLEIDYQVPYIAGAQPDAATEIVSDQCALCNPTTLPGKA